MIRISSLDSEILRQFIRCTCGVTAR